VEVKVRPVPFYPNEFPVILEEFRDDRVHAFVVRWKKQTAFDDGFNRASM
jgi:hypothetical protein